MSSTQINAAAAPNATAARVISVNKAVYWGINLGIAILLIGGGVILAKTGLDFSWKLIVAFTLIFVGGKLGKMKLPTNVTPFIWPGIIRLTGWLVLIIVLLFSGFGEITRKWSNQAEATVSTLATLGPCPEEKVLLNVGTEFTMRGDCDLVVIVPEALRKGTATTKTVLADEEVATGLKDKTNYYFTSTWEGTKKGEIRFVPNPKKFQEAGRKREGIRFVVKWNIDLKEAME